jgi:hypothetical protein
MARVRLVPCAIVLAVASVAVAGGVRDLADAWLVDGARTARLLADGRAGRGVWLETSHGRLWSVPELPQFGLSLSHLGGGHRVELAWEQLGSSIYRERAGHLFVAVGRGWSVGAGIVHRGVQIAGQEGRGHDDGFVQLEGPRDGPIRAGWRLPLGPVAPWFGERGIARWLWVAGDAADMAWTIGLDRRGDGTPSLQLEALVALSGQVAWGARFDAASGSIGFSLAWRVGGILMRSSHLTHPELGVMHRWGLGVRR